MKAKVKASIKEYLLSHTIAVVAMAVLAMIFIGNIFYNLYRTGTKSNIVSNQLGFSVEDQDEYMKSKSDVASDIEGMSQYDKYVKGLDWRDGSDSDGDGLTDKEEIEVYGTDPLKASTADDLYTDGYKVQNGMNPLTYYEMSEVSFPNNGCDELSFLSVSANNLAAYAEYSTANQPLTDYKINNIYKEYYIHDYDGAVSIDVSDILNENGIKLSNLSIYVSNTFVIENISEPENCKYTTDGNVITLDKNFERGSGYCIYVAKKNSVIGNIITGATAALSKKTTSDSITVLCETNLINGLRHKGGSYIVYYPQQNTEAETETLKTAIYNYYVGYIADFANIPYENIIFNEVSENEISAKSKILSTALSPFYLDTSKFEKMPWYWFFFTYRTDTIDVYTTNASASSSSGNTDTNTIVKYRAYHTSFDPYTDELPFQNFQSQYGTTGNCAAIAYLTSCLFNKGYYPTSGSYAGIDWNLNTDSENATLSDAGLYDYKTRSFVDDNSINDNGYLDESTLTAGEAEFVKMIGAAFIESQDRLPYLNEYMISNSSQYLDWSVAETIMERLNQGKVVNVGLYLADGTGHEVTIYDYLYVSDDNVQFRVYDCNMPQDQTDDKLTSNACYIYCTKTAKADGNYEMKYIYAPLKGNMSYMATSESYAMSTSSFILSDDDWNVLN